ncbi:hypothetical protein MPLB_1210004 [Mesorhizobium sp. ORS 3324]|nr:hypothetical protein MPLB_1210004 [Mesorhizobium sp. ORS 3324]
MSSPSSCSDGSPSLNGVGQLVFAGGDIGPVQQKLNRKSEALDMKSDIDCDIFGQNALQFAIIYNGLIRKSGRYASGSYASCGARMAGKPV